MAAGLFSALLAIFGALVGAYIGGRQARRATVDAIAAQREIDERRAEEEHRRRDAA